LLDIVGDGPQRSELEHLVDALDLRARVVFHGEQPHARVVEFFQRSEVFCFPTLSEGFGIVLLEAMASCNIVVASRCTAVPEIVRHKETGLLFEAGSVESLTSTLAPILRQPDRFRHLTTAARAAACAFDIPVIGLRLAEILEAIGEANP
jgi:glycosyltransferase involved in cell wall biosynthesis